MKSNLTIILHGQETTVEMNTSHTILSACFRNRIKAPNSCQKGTCGTCKAKITQGKAAMSTRGILTLEEIKNGYILTCKAHPKTTDVSISFDAI